MKFAKAVATALALAALAYSTLSSAESGAPSRQEIGPAVSGDLVSNGGAQVNDYARYLMVVDGRTRADAEVEARNYPTLNSSKVVQARDIGSYARYLMVVDGLRYEEAIDRAKVQDDRHVARLLVAR